MFARVARFERGDPSQLDQTIEGVRNQLGSDPPPGLEGAKRVMMLVDRSTGDGLGVTFFDSEEELRRGDEALNNMTPPGPGAQRTSVEMWEVVLDQQLG